MPIDREERPVAWDLLPRSTADQTVSMIATLRACFQIRRVIVVADRGMPSRGTIALREQDAMAPFDFILDCGSRPWSWRRAGSAGRYRPIAENLEVEAVTITSSCYVVSRNPDGAKQEAVARDAILA